MSKKISLSTYLAHAGICSRRKADRLVRDGQVQLNGEVESEPGTPVVEGDKVVYQGSEVVPEKKIYILLNKASEYLSAASDECRDRKTVLDLVKDACSERVYPVGRLDYRTTGLILLTNDGDFSQQLAHPKFNVQKTYQATLDRPFRNDDLQKMQSGLVLDDGPIQVDEAYRDKKSNDAKRVIVVLHSGRKRIVRRMFKYLGYTVELLDRINYAGITKDGLAVGKWRFLTNDEVGKLKNL